MTLRTGHGTGRGSPRIEVMPADELPPLNADLAAQGAEAARVRGRPFERGNRAALGRKPAMASLGVRVDAADPRYRRALRKAVSYRRRRVAELTRDHGGSLSAGVCALVASASLALAASRYLYELAGETGDAALLKQASALANDARQGELAALELASREAAVRPKLSPLAALEARLAATTATPADGPEKEPT